MNGLEVNEYITKATEALNDDPEHEKWWQASYKERGRMQDETRRLVISKMHLFV